MQRTAPLVRRLIQLAEIERAAAAGGGGAFLRCWLSPRAFRLGRLGSFLGGELRVALGLLTRGIGFFGFRVLSSGEGVVLANRTPGNGWPTGGTHFFEFSFDPLAHFLSSSAATLASSAAFLPAAASAFCIRSFCQSVSLFRLQYRVAICGGGVLWQGNMEANIRGNCRRPSWSSRPFSLLPFWRLAR
jgi:hypothetical protein